MDNRKRPGYCHHRRNARGRCVTAWGLGFLLLLIAVPANGLSPDFAFILAGMQDRLAATTDYRCRFETQSSNGEESRDVVLAYFYRHPGKIRMEVIEGPYAGSFLIYNQAIDPERVRVLAGNRLVAFLQRMLYGEFFAVDHEWVVDLRGNGIHESDWPHFIAEHEKFLKGGTCLFLGEEILKGRKTYYYKLISDAPEKTQSIKTEDLWVDAETYFPVQYFQYDAAGLMIRKAIITDLKFNSGIDERLFVDFYPEDE